MCREVAMGDGDAELSSFPAWPCSTVFVRSILSKVNHYPPKAKSLLKASAFSMSLCFTVQRTPTSPEGAVWRGDSIAETV